MDKPTKVLLVDDEELIRLNLRAFFEDLGFQVAEAGDGREALEAFARQAPDIVFTDLRMPVMDGMALIAALREVSPDTPVIVISGTGSMRDAIEAVRKGAWDYITKPVRQAGEIEIIAKRALERARLIAENKAHREHLEDLVRLRTEELRESEARFRTLFESASDAIVLLRDGRIVACNPRALELFGCSYDEIADRTLLAFSPLRQPDGSFSTAKIGTYLRKALAGEPQFYEWQHAGRSGATFDAEISLNSLDLHGAAYLQAIIRDVTLRKQKDAQILKLSTAVEQSANSILVLARDGRIEYLNPKFSEMTGFSAKEALGKTPVFLKSGLHSRQFYDTLRRAIVAGEEWRGEICNRKKDGGLIWQLTTITPIRDAGGKVTNFVAIEEDITEKKQFEERLYRQANYDALTGLPNRYLLVETLERILDGVRGTGKILYLMLLDIDRFEYINDTLGHFQGDELLRQMAAKLGEFVREGDILARFVGDEFVMAVSWLESEEEATAFASRVCAALASPFSVGPTDLYVTVSVGVVACAGEVPSVSDILRDAEAALHNAQKEGVNKIRFFTREISDLARARFSTAIRLHKALEGEEFFLCYQPQIELSTKAVSGVEALLRWAPPGEAVVLPALFIPVLEESGLIVPVGEWALRRACRQQREWLDAGVSPFTMSVNISGWQLRSGRLPESVRSAIDDFGIVPSSLCLELTESVVMYDMEEAIKTLQRLSDMGITLSIDDFGTGYSSLSYLRRMPIHELKIDRSFITHLPVDANSVAIAGTILGMAESLKLSVVAEGVETAEQLGFLAGHNCGRIQGYYFSRPLPPEEVPAFIMKREKTHQPHLP